MSNIIEGFWDCPFCGTKGVQGSLRNCPHCGNPRGEDTKFYVNKNSRKLSEEEAKKVSKKPDWMCSYCNTLNPDSSKTCKSCGAAKSDSKTDYFGLQQKLAEKEKTLKAKEEEKKPKSATDIATNIVAILIMGLIVLAVVSGIRMLIPKNQEMTVTKVSWERNIEVENLKTFSESDWSLPEGARLKHTETEIKEYDKVIDHYETKTKTVEKQVVDHYEEVSDGEEDLGNGYFKEKTKQVPVYKTVTEEQEYQDPVYKNVPVYAKKYYYDIDRWVKARDISSSGSDKNPVWGDVKLGEKEREGKKTEKYIAVFKNKKGKEQDVTLDYGEWSKVEVGKNVKVKVFLGNITGLAENGSE